MFVRAKMRMKEIHQANNTEYSGRDNLRMVYKNYLHFCSLYFYIIYKCFLLINSMGFYDKKNIIKLLKNNNTVYGI